MIQMPPTAPPPPSAVVLPLSESAKVRYVVIGLLVAIVCAFAGVVQCDFVQFNDLSHVLQNPLVRGGLTWNGIMDAFT